jgi:Cu/Ag efflux protein CusF
MMRSKLWVNAVLMALAVAAACARKEQAPAATGGELAATPAEGVEKTYPFRGKVVSLDRARNEITVDHERVEGLWEPMTMAFEVRGGESGSLPPEGSTIRATLHVQDGRWWLTDVKTE